MIFVLFHISLVVCLVRLLQGAYYAARIAQGKHAGRDVFRHHAACTDDGSFANRHTGQYDHVGGYPYIVADVDGEGTHDARVALLGIEGMDDGAQAGVGTNENVVADAHFCFVQDGQVEVAHKVVAYVDVCAEVAVERAMDDGRLADMSEQCPDDLLPFGASGGRQ